MMANPVTDGQLGDETPPLVERVLATLVAVGILFAAFRLGVLAWPRVSWLLPSAILMSTACVWFPDPIGGLLSISSAGSAEVPALAVRVGGWSIILGTGVVLAALWLLGR